MAGDPPKCKAYESLSFFGKRGDRRAERCTQAQFFVFDRADESG